MKRNLIWMASTLSAGVLMLGYHTSLSGKATASTEAPISSGGTTTSSATPRSSTGSGARGTSAKSATHRKSPTTKSKSTTVTGDTVQTQWGPVQVQLTIASGKIQKVSVLQYPNGNSRDVQIANYSLPILIRETTSAQSAHIDMVSGASYTSQGYIQSLQSALDKAKL